MSGVTSNWVRVSVLSDKTEESVDILIKSSRNITAKTAHRIAATMRQSMRSTPRSPSTGRSLPGNPPAVETREQSKIDPGKLLASIREVAVGPDEWGISADVRGLWQEYGQFGGAPRPWIRPAVEKWRPSYIHDFSQMFSGGSGVLTAEELEGGALDFSEASTAVGGSESGA